MKSILTFFLLLAVVPICTANLLYIEQDEAGAFITFSSDQSVDIAAYVLQLNFSPNTSIVALKPEPPFMGAVNIVQEDYCAKISGFTVEPAPNNRLAAISYLGGDEPEIFVIELYDSDSKPVTVTNQQMTPPVTPLPTSQLPTYNPNPGYVSPASLEYNSRIDIADSTLSSMHQESTQTTSGVSPLQTQSLQENPVPMPPVQSSVYESQTPSVTPEGRATVPGTQELPINCFISIGALIFVLIVFKGRRKPF